MIVRARCLTAAAALLVVAGVLAGCAAPQDDADSTSSPSASRTPSSSASPSPTESATDAPADPGDDGATGEVTAGGIAPVELAMPFRNALSAIGATPVAGCAWAGSVDSGGYSTVVVRESDGDDVSPVVLVSASVPADQVSVTGPTTAEGIGIGSTVAEVRAAYPDAEPVSSPEMGDRRYLKVLAIGDAAVFFSYTQGQDVVWAVTSTVLPMPPYEYCA